VSCSPPLNGHTQRLHDVTLRPLYEPRATLKSAGSFQTSSPTTMSSCPFPWLAAAG